MNGRNSRYGAPGIVVLLVAALALPGALGAEMQEGRAIATVYSGGVDFLPNVDYSRAVITVSGNDQTFRRVAYPGERLSIDMFDPDGQPLADGVYSWSLELRPSAEAAWELKKAASRNGGEAPSPWLPQTGTFTIRNGLMADPGLAEPGTSRRRESVATGFSAAIGTSLARASAPDTDEAVGSRVGVEADSKADSAGGRHALAIGPQQARTSQRSDATAYALGQSLENPSNNDRAASSPDAAPARRSTSADGADGRPRSAEDQ